MRRTVRRDSPQSEPAARACLERTRSAVLNILVAVGLTIAASGLLLRNRPQENQPRGSPAAYRRLMVALATIGVSSYVARGVLIRRLRHLDVQLRESRFFWAHVIPAAVAAAAAPLGLFCGWFVDPRLGAVSPFWVVALALGFAAVPRGHEIEVLEPVKPSAGAQEA
jgi:hypothetical protein